MSTELKYRPSLSVVAVLTVFCAMAHAAGAGEDVARPVTFTKDVAPILQEKCQGCHRAGDMAPMSLVTYQETRPWARAIKQKVSKREMPPWFIDRTVGIQKYKNDDSLTDAQIATIVTWVDTGAPEGNRADMPPAKVFASNQGWDIGTPDLILRKPKPFNMYAQGSDWWLQETVETGLTEDRWVKAVQLKPGNRKIVHHFCAGPVPSRSAGAANVGPVGPPDRYAAEEREAASEERKLAGEGVVGAAAGQAVSGGIGGGSLGCYLPGRGGVFFSEDTGVLLKAGSKVSIGFHYSASGEEASDDSSIGVVFYPKGVTPTHAVKGGFFQKFPAFELDIPANARVTNDAYMRLVKPTRLLSFQPHMHMRGAALVLEAILPSGRVLTISGVTNYNFGWQLEYVYDEDLTPLLPAGTMLHAIVVHDNTAENRFNPDPNRWVGYGQASTEEMAGSFVTYIEITDEEYRKLASERRAKQRMSATQQE
jgi:hypothetical protein